MLEDGSVWKGTAFGAKGTEVGEVVFNTSITGYQEIMTDPSYKGQFVCFTHPHIGNVGINDGEQAVTAMNCGSGCLAAAAVASGSLFAVPSDASHQQVALCSPSGPGQA